MSGIGTADTSEIIRAKISATRPARERIFEWCIIVGPADWKVEKVWAWDSYRYCFRKAVLSLLD